ncbi:unnamed protein product, partial [Choristocarpus tenellus]
MEDVRLKLKDQPELYAKFVKVLMDHKNGCCKNPTDTAGVVNHLTNILRGHDSLILGLNMFLPNEEKVDIKGLSNSSPLNRLDSDTVVHPVEGRPRVVDAIDYMDDVKAKLIDQPEVYAKFVQVLADFGEEATDNNPQLIKQVANILRGHDSLVIGFNKFLPDSEKMEIGKDLDPPHHEQLPAPAASSPLNEKLRAAEVASYMDDVKNKLIDHPELFAKFLLAVNGFREKAIDTSEVIKQMANILRGHDSLILGFNTFLPSTNQIDLEDLKRWETECSEKNQWQGAALSPQYTSLIPAVPNICESSTAVESIHRSSSPPQASPGPIAVSQKPLVTLNPHQSVDFHQPQPEAPEVLLPAEQQKQLIDLSHTSPSSSTRTEPTKRVLRSKRLKKKRDLSIRDEAPRATL